MFSTEELIINIGGRKYTVLRKTISSFPKTRLGKIAKTSNEDEIRAVFKHKCN